MLLEQRFQDRIDQAIEEAYLSFLIMMVGYTVLSEEDKRKATAAGLVEINRPLIENLYLIARNRSNEEGRKAVPLRDLIATAGLSASLAVTTDAEAYSVEHAKREMYDTLQNSKEELKKRIRQGALRLNDAARLSQIKDVATEADKKENLLNEFIAVVGGAVSLVTNNFTRGATVALTNLVGNAAVDEIRSKPNYSMYPDKTIRLYKRVVNDGRLCGWCSSFYQNKDGSPKVYTLEELLANGSNDGKPKSQWKPVIGSTHPRCRCQLHYLTPGQEDPR